MCENSKFDLEIIIYCLESSLEEYRKEMNKVQHELAYCPAFSKKFSVLCERNRVVCAKVLKTEDELAHFQSVLDSY